MNKKKKILILIGLILLTIMVILAFALARYAANSIWDYYLKSRGFYFKSSQLSINGTKNVNTSWDGQSVYFDLKNYTNTDVTEFDINYNVSCEITSAVKDSAQCVIKESNSDFYEGVLSASQYCENNKGDSTDVSSYGKTDCELGGYDWVYQKSKKDFYFDIIPNDESVVLNDVQVLLKINGIKPYQEQLSGTFVLSKSDYKSEDIILKVINNSSISNLIVKNSYLAGKCVTLTWNADQIRVASDKTMFDNSSNNAEGVVNQVKLMIDQSSSKVIDFYKVIDNQISTDMFTVDVANNC